MTVSYRPTYLLRRRRSGLLLRLPSPLQGRRDSPTLCQQRTRSFPKHRVSSSPSLAAEAMVLNSFPDDIIRDLLLRLPIKCLIRCTSVCKTWKSIIKSSKFIYTYLNRTIKANDQHGTHLLLHHGRYKNFLSDKEEEVYSLHYDNHAFDEYCQIDFKIDSMVRKANDHFRVAGICNGLICLADDIISKFFNYILWNPSIRKAVMLPWPHVTFNSHGPFDDTVGFGFDALTSDYKVVRLVTLEHYSRNNEYTFEPTLAEVYSLATGSWRSLGSIASCCDISARTTYIFLDGAIHWAVRRWDDDCSFILTFNVGSESFGEIMMPDSIRSHQFLMGSKVAVSGDGKSLALFTTCKKDIKDDHFLDIWVMKEYGVQESWTKLMTLGPQEWLPRALSFRKNGEVFVLHRTFIFEKNILFSLDLASQKINILESCQNKYFYSVHSYAESLVLLDVSNAVSC